MPDLLEEYHVLGFDVDNGFFPFDNDALERLITLTFIDDLCKNFGYPEAIREIDFT